MAGVQGLRRKRLSARSIAFLRIVCWLDPSTKPGLSQKLLTAVLAIQGQSVCVNLCLSGGTSSFVKSVTSILVNVLFSFLCCCVVFITDVLP